jgi:protein gp37/ParB-like chromosome segregation protein Spo0J
VNVSADKRPELTNAIIRAYGLNGIHPAAELFPLMDDEAFAALVADVKAQGFTDAVVVDPDHMLLDGRNRLLAGWVLSLDPPIRAHHVTDPVGYVLATNLHRRHLTIGQRAMLATRLADLDRGRPTEEMGNSAHLTQPEAAAMVGVGERSVKKARVVLEEAPELAEEVDAGKAPLDQAAKEAAKRRKARQADQPAPDAKPTAASTTITLLTDTGIEVSYPKPKAKATFNPTNEHISWAAWSWNPVTGCNHGCPYCYARELATKASYAASYPVGFTPLFHHERLDAPVNTAYHPADVEADPRRGRVFVCSMADLFGRWVPDEWIDAVFLAAGNAPQWEYLFLTKFPGRYRKLTIPPKMWAGASVDRQYRVSTVERDMPEVDAAVRWLSIEPLLEPLVFDDLSWCDLVVIGAQTATNQPDGPVDAFAPPMQWVSDIVAQADVAGVPVYLKPNLLGDVHPQAPGMTLRQETPRRRTT